MRRIWRHITQNFDRAFSRSKGRQFIWLLGFLIFFLLFFWILALIIYPAESLTEGDSPWHIRILELLLDPGAFVGSFEYGTFNPRTGVIIFQFLITIAGAIFFTSFMINSIGNWLDRRLDAVASGRCTYSFEDHIVFFGANAMLETILKSLTADSSNLKCDYVIVTDREIEKIRDRIYAQLPEKFYRNVYLVCGDRTEENGLPNLHLKRARSIYILGEDSESFHDARNLECWKLLRKHCEGMSRTINCFLVLDKASSVRSFLYKDDDGSTDCLHLTLINAVENLAQRVFVSRGFEGKERYPALDGEGISAESQRQVHLVIFGMTQVSYAMATTAAHICHFPNFKNGIRTKITFVAEGIRQEMDYFNGRYCHLMEASYSRFISWDDAGMEKVVESFPKKEYLGKRADDHDPKGYLDIEWEFIDAGIETVQVRKYLCDCVRRHKEGYEQLTLALCENDHEGNVAASMCLPPDIYDNKITTLVYQPYSGEILRFARDSGRFSNIYPFGLKVDCFDPWLQTRLMRARRIKYVYDCQKTGQQISSMPDDAELQTLTSWFKTSYSHQLSNIYASNSLETKLRSIGQGETSMGGSLTEEDIAVIAEIEHNRWNVERLLCGMRVMPASLREELRRDLRSTDPEKVKEARMLMEKYKRDFSTHINIVPYSELFDEDKEYDTSIARNIPLVMKDPQIVS